MKNQFAISKMKKLLSINFEYVSTNKKKRNEFEIYVKNKERKRRKITEIHNNAFE